MSYVKELFLQKASKLVAISTYDEEVDKRRRQALKDIIAAYEAQPELEHYLLCEKVAELARSTVVDGQLIYGRWEQLDGLVELYATGKIHDIGITANIAVQTLNTRGGITSGTSAFIHDRGAAHLEVVCPDWELRQEVWEQIKSLDGNLSRQQFFTSLAAALKRAGTKKRQFYTEISHYLYIDGSQDYDLLTASPYSFAGGDSYVYEREDRLAEYSHFQALLEPLDKKQLQHLLKFCGFDDELPAKKTDWQYEAQERLWQADRQDFYWEYEWLTSKKKRAAKQR